jgi:hypothetical protein
MHAIHFENKNLTRKLFLRAFKMSIMCYKKKKTTINIYVFSQFFFECYSDLLFLSDL